MRNRLEVEAHEAAARCHGSLSSNLVPHTARGLGEATATTDGSTSRDLVPGVRAAVAAAVG